jgi:predicted nucleic acid-binding protein
VIIDTNVFAYALLIEEDRHEQAGTIIEAVDRIVVPDSFWAELVSAVWQWHRAGRVDLDEAIGVLGRAVAFVTDDVETNTLWKRALTLAVETDHSPYDALFAALAERRGTRVITYDERFRRAFPGLTISPAEFLGD